MSSGTNLGDASAGPFSGASGKRLNLTADVQLTAQAGVHTLTVTDAGSGAGTVQSSPAGIEACSSSCSLAFDDGTAVTLTASPDSYSTFAGWSGGGCSGTGTCQVTIGAETAVTATFNTTAAPGNGGYTYGSGYESGYGTPGAENAGGSPTPGGEMQEVESASQKRAQGPLREEDEARRQARRQRDASARRS